MRGVIGRFFFEYGLAISFAVAFSLLVAVTITPSVSARVLRREESHGRVFRALEKLYVRLESAFAALLTAALRLEQELPLVDVRVQRVRSPQEDQPRVHDVLRVEADGRAERHVTGFVGGAGAHVREQA